MFEPNTHRTATCEQCGRRFVDDCGDAFCSSSCEREYAYDHAECTRCGDEVGQGNLSHGLCEFCDARGDELDD